jgi:hypothetical protein
MIRPTKGQSQWERAYKHFQEACCIDIHSLVLELPRRTVVLIIGLSLSRSLSIFLITKTGTKYLSRTDLGDITMQSQDDLYRDGVEFITRISHSLDLQEPL